MRLGERPRTVSPVRESKRRMEITTGAIAEASSTTVQEPETTVWASAH